MDALNNGFAVNRSGATINVGQSNVGLSCPNHQVTDANRLGVIIPDEFYNNRDGPISFAACTCNPRPSWVRVRFRNATGAQPRGFVEGLIPWSALQPLSRWRSSILEHPWDGSMTINGIENRLFEVQLRNADLVNSQGQFIESVPVGRTIASHTCTMGQTNQHLWIVHHVWRVVNGILRHTPADPAGGAHAFIDTGLLSGSRQTTIQIRTFLW